MARTAEKLAYPPRTFRAERVWAAGQKKHGVEFIDDGVRLIPEATAMKKQKKRPPTSRGHLPQTVRADVFLWHNHVMHTADMGTGLNGFRYRYAYKPVNYRTFMRCECGWSGLPHYSIRARGKQKCHSPIEIAKAVGLDKKLPGLMAAIIEAARKPEGNA